MAAVLSVVVLVCAVGVLVCVYVWAKYKRMWELGEKIPGPKIKNLLLGNADVIFTKPHAFLPSLLEQFEEYGPIFRLWVGPELVVLLKDPADIQAVLGDKDVRNRPANFMHVIKNILGPGIVTHRDEQWKITRKVFAPTFNTKTLEGFMDEFGRKARILTDKLEGVSDGQVFNLKPYVLSSIMETVCNTVMGATSANQYVDLDEFTEELNHHNTLMLYLVSRPWLLLFPNIYAMTRDGQRVKKFKKICKSFSSWVISQRISDNQVRVGTTNGGGRKALNFIDAMMDASKGGETLFSLEQIKAEVVEMSAAASSTTSLAIIYTIMLIARHPEIQNEVHQELDEVFGSDSRPATLEDIKKLDVLDRCIRETLRLFPVSSLNPRDVPKDIRLPSGYVLPAGCATINLMHAVHRDPRYFSEPNKFWPNRWLPENKKNNPPFSYLPYSAGSRDCIGKRYAQMQMKVLLSQVLRAFFIHPVIDMKTMDENLILSLVLTINDEVGYPVRITRR